MKSFAEQKRASRASPESTDARITSQARGPVPSERTIAAQNAYLKRPHTDLGKKPLRLQRAPIHQDSQYAAQQNMTANPTTAGGARVPPMDPWDQRLRTTASSQKRERDPYDTDSIDGSTTTHSVDMVRPNRVEDNRFRDANVDSRLYESDQDERHEQQEFEDGNDAHIDFEDERSSEREEEGDEEGDDEGGDNIDEASRMAGLNSAKIRQMFDEMIETTGAGHQPAPDHFGGDQSYPSTTCGDTEDLQVPKQGTQADHQNDIPVRQHPQTANMAPNRPQSQPNSKVHHQDQRHQQEPTASNRQATTQDLLAYRQMQPVPQVNFNSNGGRHSTKAVPAKQQSGHDQNLATSRAIGNANTVITHSTSTSATAAVTQDNIASQHFQAGMDSNHDPPNATNAEPLELDYEGDALTKKTFSELRDEPFDLDPKKPKIALPGKLAKAALNDRLAHARKEFNETQQEQFFNSLPIAEWNEAGDWFLQRFGESMQKIIKLRQDMREEAAKHEEKVSLRDRYVDRKRQRLEDEMVQMRSSGSNLLRTPRKKV